MSTPPQLPRPEWAKEILEALLGIPEMIQVQRSLAAEQENLRRVREQRDMLVNELKTIRMVVAEKNAKIAELEQVIIERLRNA